MAQAVSEQKMSYAEIARRLVTEYASYKISYGEIETEAIIDDANGHYLVTHVGWDNRGFRAYGPAIHIDLINGKFWIQHDSTDWVVADRLLEAGVPKENIVLAFHPPEIRPHTE
ncbi:MAG: XisI protein, partial [Acidobacteria bacterium]|nr:XisI protein [Acidobacteriota bacterium]